MSLREEILQEGKRDERLLQNQDDIHYFLEGNMRDEAEDHYKKVTSIQDIESLRVQRKK